MKLPIYVAELIQERLASIVMDCDYPRSFYQYLPREIDANIKWKISIEILYRLFVCSLIVPAHYRNEVGSSKSQKLSKNMVDECRNYLSTLSQTNPESNEINDYVIWQEWDLCIGNQGKDLLLKHGIVDPESPLNDDFVTDLENRFTQENVAWKDL